jgi:hypothetical protein
MPLIERFGTQEDLDRLRALLIGFPIRPRVAPVDASETTDVDDVETSACSPTEETQQS